MSDLGQDAPPGRPADRREIAAAVEDLGDEE
jgi:hypothetical protein